jgi:hypothetical protein
MNIDSNDPLLQRNSFNKHILKPSSILIILMVIAIILIIAVIVLIPASNVSTYTQPLSDNLSVRPLYGYQLSTIDETPIYNIGLMRNWIADSNRAKQQYDTQIDALYSKLMENPSTAISGSTDKEKGEYVFRLINSMYYVIRYQKSHPQTRRFSQISVPNDVLTDVEMEAQQPEETGTDNATNVTENNQMPPLLFAQRAVTETNNTTNNTANNTTNNTTTNTDATAIDAAAIEFRNCMRILTVIEYTLNNELEYKNITTDSSIHTVVLLFDLCAAYLLSYDPLQFTQTVTLITTYLPTLAELKLNNVQIPITGPIQWRLACPWLLAQLYKGEIYNTIITDKNYYQMMLQLNTTYNMNPNSISLAELGSHFTIDNAYIYFETARSDLLGIGLENIVQQHFKADQTALKYKISLPIKRWQYHTNVILHKNSDYAAPGLFGPNVDLRYNLATNKNNAQLGIAIIPSLAYLRYYTDTWAFSVRGYRPSQKLAVTTTNWQLSTDTNIKNSMYLTMFLRDPINITKTVAVDLSKQMYGAILTADNSYASIEVPTNTDNYKAFSLQYENFGVFYYEHPAYFNAEVSMFEYIICDSKKSQIKHIIQITPPTQTNTEAAAIGGIYTYSESEVDIGSTPSKQEIKGSTLTYETVFNLNTGKVSTKPSSNPFDTTKSLPITTIRTSETGYDTAAYHVEFNEFYAGIKLAATLDQKYQALTLLSIAHIWPITITLNNKYNYKLSPDKQYQYTTL